MPQVRRGRGRPRRQQVDLNQNVEPANANIRAGSFFLNSTVFKRSKNYKNQACNLKVCWQIENPPKKLRIQCFFAKFYVC